jgi:hypothetical protein
MGRGCGLWAVSIISYLTLGTYRTFDILLSSNPQLQIVLAVTTM